MKDMKVVFFDLYGTLIRIHTDEEDLTRVWRPLCYLYGYYGASYTPGTLRAAYRREISRQEAAAQAATGKRLVEIRLEQVFGALFAQKEVASVPPSVLAEVGRMFRACSTDVSELYPGAGSLLDALRGAGKRVFLLSNAQRLFTEPEMRRLRLWDRFDKIFISSDHGVKKPDLDYFRLALQAAGVPPRNCLMVGNSPEDDMAPARALGIRTCFLNTDGVTPPPCDLYCDGADYARLLREVLA